VRSFPVQYCPYCGEQDLRPHEEHAEALSGAWRCADCRSTFVVTPAGAAASTGAHR
jgi:transposase-like protein